MAPALIKFRRIGQALQRLLVPSYCLVCRMPLQEGQQLAFCHGCQSELRDPQAMACDRCGARPASAVPVSDGRSPGCRLCRDWTRAPARVECLGNYVGLMRQLVLQMKTRGHETLAIQFGKWLGWQWNRPRGGCPAIPDLVVPVPVYWLRHLRRGYDVTELLVDGLLSTIDGQPRRCNALRAVRQTRKQGTLTTRQRFANVRGCFSVAEPRRIRQKRILLVDDVMTSGATAGQASQTLLDAGAAEVYLAVVARGVGQHD